MIRLLAFPTHETYSSGPLDLEVLKLSKRSVRVSCELL